MQLTDQILDYYNNFSESKFLDNLAASAATEDLFSAVSELLRSSDRDTVSTTLIFVQDMLRWYPGEARANFTAKFDGSSVVQALESLLFSPNHFTRLHTVNVIQRTCENTSAPALEKAFWKFNTTDPILAPELLSLFGYMTDTFESDRFAEMLNSLVLNSHYVVRWAAVESVLGMHNQSPQMAQKYQNMVGRIRQDENCLVRQEAEYLYQLQTYRQCLDDLPNAARKRTIKQIEREYCPAITFDVAKLRFYNWLNSEGLQDYTIEQFEDFLAL
jgi:hypothetical protein